MTDINTQNEHAGNLIADKSKFLNTLLHPFIGGGNAKPVREKANQIAKMIFNGTSNYQTSPETRLIQLDKTIEIFNTSGLTAISDEYNAAKLKNRWQEGPDPSIVMETRVFNALDQAHQAMVLAT